MNRRECLKYLAVALAVDPIDLMAAVPCIREEDPKKSHLASRNSSHKPVEGLELEQFWPEDRDAKDHLIKFKNPDLTYPGDIVLSQKLYPLLTSIVGRFYKIQAYVGHGNFCLLSLDESYRFAKYGPDIGAFTSTEKKFLEEVFFRDAKDYGFLGEKTMTCLDGKIKRHMICRLPNNGNFLFKGASLAKYRRVREDIGEALILTSGIRNLAKQFYLFLHKAYLYEGNFSLASRSLAPPGYSFHATGDFDVGQRGYGRENFTEKFTGSYVYKELIKRGYVDYRYGKDNVLGVRYEPWHIKV